jgi:Protein of unknown function (DUF3592)
MRIIGVMQQSSERPLPVTVAAWIILLWSGLAGTVSALRLARVVDLPTVYMVVLSLAKIVCAIAILRGVRGARVAFLVLYFVAVTIAGPYVHWREIVNDRLLGTYVIAFVLFFVYWIALAPPNLGWLVRNRAVFARFGARAFVTVSALLVAFFVVRAALDLYAAMFYRRAEAEIVAADVRDADVSTSMQRDPTSSSNRARSTTTIVTHDPKITFRYTVDGQTYERTGFTTFGSTLTATFSPAKVRDKYEVGTKQICFYDPFNPSRAVLEFGVSPYYAFAFFALILLTIARTIAAHVLSRG